VSSRAGVPVRGSSFRMCAITVAGLTAAVAFASLGCWQIARRAQKLDLIERVETRVHAAPVVAPGPTAWDALNARNDEYKRVRVSGRFLDDRETLVTAATEYGSGYWVVTPLQTAQGFSVLVNRGFVPPEKKARAERPEDKSPRETTVTGLLRMTEPKGAFLRTNDPSADRWFSRDVDAIAAKRGLMEYAPYFIDADGTPNPGGYPIGGLTVISFANNHLVYALTWFALALMSAAGAARFIGEEMKARRVP
jgi:surfeit locus 1 family protein